MNGGLYVHHDMLIGNYPLSLAWIAGNHCVVGTFDTCIELWDIDRACDDVIPEPVATLGLPREDMIKFLRKSSKKKKPTMTAEASASHQDAVLCLQANPFQHHILASGSADNTVKLWDLGKLQLVNTLNHHKDKLQVVAWSPDQCHLLLTGGYDKQLAVADTRSEQKAVLFHSLPNDPEFGLWSRNHPHLMVSDDHGVVRCFDSRRGDALLWELQAHDVECTSIVESCGAKNFLGTTGVDGVVKLWDLSKGEPRLVYEKDMQAGPLFSAAMCADVDR